MNLREEKFRYFIIVLLTVLLIGSLLIAALPAFNGELEGLYFNENLKGYTIPSDYVTVRNFLDGHNGSVLLLPSSDTYVQTGWGFQGAVTFYNDFFSPTPFYTLINFGGGYASNFTKSLYANLTQPMLLARTFNRPIDGNITADVYGTAFNATENSITLYPSNSSSPLEVAFAIPKPIDISNYTFLKISIGITNQNFFESLLNLKELWIGLATGSEVGWYILNSDTNSYTESSTNNSLSFYLMMGSPDQPWPASVYNPLNVTTIFFRFPDSNQILSMSYPILDGMVGYSLDPSWLGLLIKYHVHFILVDKSWVVGNTTSYEYISKVLTTANMEGVTQTVYEDASLELIEIVQ